MTLKEYQQELDNWIREIGGGYFNVTTNALLLAEETGEVARVVVRRYGEQQPKPDEPAADLADELADVIRVATCIAIQTGIDLESALRRNLDKIATRDQKRFKK